MFQLAWYLPFVETYLAHDICQTPRYSISDSESFSILRLNCCLESLNLSTDFLFQMCVPESTFTHRHQCKPTRVLPYGTILGKYA